MSDAEVTGTPESAPAEAPVAEGQAQAASADLATQVKEAAEAGASQEEIKQMIKEFDLKVNGKSKKVKVDLSDDKYLIQQLQKAEAFSQTAQEKAELERMIDQALAGAKNDPWSFLKELGFDPDDLAERRISERIEEMKKSPEQVEREKMQKELEQARMQLKKIEQEKIQAQQMQMQTQAMTQIDKDITEALQADPELPKTKKTVGRIADALLWAMDNGFADATVADVLPAVKAEMRAEMDEFLSNMNDELLENWVGKKNIERMRKRRLAAAKVAAPAPVESIKPVAKSADKPSEKAKSEIGSKDFFRKLGM